MAFFPFLDLPPEIRSKIYHQICTSPFPIPLSDETHEPVFQPDGQDYPQIFPHSLLLTNSQIYHEIRPIYFTANTFTLFLAKRNDFLRNTILDPSFRDNLLQIRSLTVKIWRWGSKDFFVKTLVPMLEECILKGRLRVLEVVIRERDAVGGEGENWDALRRVLGDRDLEVGRLFTSTMLDEVSERWFLGEEPVGRTDVTKILLKGGRWGKRGGWVSRVN